MCKDPGGRRQGHEVLHRRVSCSTTERRDEVHRANEVAFAHRYSLGGLVARYVLGLLESRTPSFFAEVRPVNFATFASPAIGM